jgi:hypothetical protein
MHKHAQTNISRRKGLKDGRSYRSRLSKPDLKRAVGVHRTRSAFGKLIDYLNR